MGVMETIFWAATGVIGFTVGFAATYLVGARAARR